MVAANSKKVGIKYSHSHHCGKQLKLFFKTFFNYSRIYQTYI